MTTALDIATSTAVENVAGSDGSVTRITLTPPTSASAYGYQTWSYKMGGVWGQDVTWSDWLTATAPSRTVTREAITGGNQWGGQMPGDLITGGGGERRPRGPVDLLDEQIVCDRDDNDYIIQTIGRNLILPISGDGTVGGWMWPAATHAFITSGRLVYLMTTAAPRSDYTSLRQGLADPQDVGSIFNWSLPTEIAMLGDPYHGSRIGGDLAAGLTWDRNEQRIFTAGNVYDPLYSNLSGAWFRFGGQSAQRSLIWGLPPTARIFFSTSGFFFSDPGPLTATTKINFLSNSTDQTSTVTIDTRSVPSTNPFGTWRLWQESDTALSLSGVAVPSWADRYIIYGEATTGGPVNWSRSDAWTPATPRHYPLALQTRGGEDWIPGVVRQVA